MNPINRLYRTVALILACGIGLPSPAFGLRPIEPVEGDAGWLLQQQLVGNAGAQLAGLQVGLEEVSFPPPVETDTAPATVIWNDAGNIYPSSRDPLASLAFVSPGDPTSHIDLYGSIVKFREVIPEAFTDPGIPQLPSSGHLYDPSVAQTAPKRIAEIFAEKGFSVYARIRRPGAKDLLVPMIPINRLDEEIRFQGRIPAEQRYVGEHTFTIEVAFKGQQYRMQETGWFRIQENGVTTPWTATPAKSKLWVNPAGQPVVAAWGLGVLRDPNPSEPILPGDDVTDGGVRRLGIRNGVKFGIVRNPATAIFVLEVEASDANQERLIKEADSLLRHIEELGPVTVRSSMTWFVKQGNKYHYFIVPRNPVLPKRLEDQGKPIADRDYWIRLWGGRYRLFSENQLRQYAFPYDPERPDIRLGEPVVDARFDSLSFRGLVGVISLEAYEDPTLAARLEKGFEVAGLPWDHGVIRTVLGDIVKTASEASLIALSQPGPVEPGFLGRLSGPMTPPQFRDLLAAPTGWPSIRSFLASAGPVEHDAVLRQLFDLFLATGQPDAAAPVARLDLLDGLPTAWLSEKTRPVVALSLNGVVDLSLSVSQTDAGQQQVIGNISEGGGPLTVARAIRNLGHGEPVTVVTVGAGATGDAMFASLERKGIDVVPVKSASTGETRISVNGRVSSSPEITMAEVEEAVKRALAKIKEYGPGGTLIVGERIATVAGTAPGYQETADRLAGLIIEAKKRDWQVAVAASSSWGDDTCTTILAANPDVFHIDIEPFSRLIGRNVDELVHPEAVAELANKFRHGHGLIALIVSLGEAGEVYVSESGWYHAVPSPVLRLSYATGARDVVLGTMIRFNQAGAPIREVLLSGVVAGVLHMENGGRPVSQADILANSHRAHVYDLLQPAKDVLIVPVNKLPGQPEIAAWWAAQQSKAPNGEAHLWVVAPRVAGPQMIYLANHPGLSVIRGTPEQVAQFFAARAGQSRLRLNVPDPVASSVRPRLETSNFAVRNRPDVPLFPESPTGLEELLEEARQGRGVLVVPSKVLDSSAGLEQLLGRLPRALAADVVVWGEGAAAERLSWTNPAVRHVREPDAVILAQYVAGMENAERVGVLGDPETAALLGRLLAGAGIPVAPVRWNLQEVLEILGVPREVSDQMDLEQLLGELVIRAGA